MLLICALCFKIIQKTTIFDKFLVHNTQIDTQTNGMRTSTKILIILTILTFVPSIFLGNYLLAAIVPTGSGFSFEFTTLAWVALAFNIVANILMAILFFRFLKTQRLANSIFFSLFPMTLTYGAFMVYIVGVKNMNGVVAESVRATLNIATEENSYNNLLWAGLATLVYLVAVFVIVLFACRPLSKVVNATDKLGDGRTKHEDFRVGGGKQFKKIENSLNKINYNIKEKENKLRQTNFATQKTVSRQFLKFLGKDSVEELELGKKIKKEATMLLCSLKSENLKMLSLEENFNYINSYFKVVSPLIKRYNGFIDKYLGDGILAVFTKPQEAIECGHAILKAIEVKNKSQKELPNIDARLCVHSDEFLFGVVGEGDRKIPTMIFEKDDISAKMQEINLYIDTKFLISKNSLENLPQNYEFEYRYTGDLSLEKSEQLPIFESLNSYAKRKREKLKKNKDLFEAGVRAYNDKKYKEAKEIFAKVLKAVADDNVAFVYFNKAEEKLKEAA